MSKNKKRGVAKKALEKAFSETFGKSSGVVTDVSDEVLNEQAFAAIEGLAQYAPQQRESFDEDPLEELTREAQVNGEYDTEPTVRIDGEAVITVANLQKLINSLVFKLLSDK